MGLLDLAVLDDEGVTLATVVSEDGGCVEVEVEGLCEGAVGVCEETDLFLAVSEIVPKSQEKCLLKCMQWIQLRSFDHNSFSGNNVGLKLLGESGMTYAALFVCVEVVCPGLHAMITSVTEHSMICERLSKDLHKGVVDRNDKDIASILEVLVVDVAGDVRLGARRAWIIEVSRVLSGMSHPVKCLNREDGTIA